MDEYNLFKVEFCLRNVIGADPFPLLWFVGLSFFTGLWFLYQYFVVFLQAYPPKTFLKNIWYQKRLLWLFTFI